MIVIKSDSMIRRFTIAWVLLLVIATCGACLGAVKKSSQAMKADVVRKSGTPGTNQPPAEPTKTEDPRKSLPTAKLSGRHISVEMPVDYWKKLRNTNDFIAILDAAFAKQAELMTPKSDIITYRTDTLKCWGIGGGGQVVVEWNAMEEVINQFNSSNIVFGMFHEMGHCFDQPGQQRWYKFPHWLNGETWANIPTVYAAEQLLTTNTNYRIGTEWTGKRELGHDFGDAIYMAAADRYLKSSNNWVNIGVDELHSFHHRFIRRYGWDVYKKWYRAAYNLEGSGSFPDGGFESSERVVVNCAFLSNFAGENLVPDFKRFRFPVTDEEVRKVTAKYKLGKVFTAVDQQFAGEVEQGTVILDPLSIRIVATNMPNGAVKVTVRTIKLNGSSVRYTVDGKQPTVASPLYIQPLLISRPIVFKAGIVCPVVVKTVTPAKPENRGLSKTAKPSPKAQQKKPQVLVVAELAIAPTVTTVGSTSQSSAPVTP